MKNPFKLFEEELRARGLLQLLAWKTQKFGIKLEDAYSKKRTKGVYEARSACWRMLSKRGWSNTEIAQLWGVDSTSVLYALKKPERELPGVKKASVSHDELVRRVVVLEAELANIYRALFLGKPRV